MKQFFAELKLQSKQSITWSYGFIVYCILVITAYWLLSNSYWNTVGPLIVWIIAITNVLLTLQSAFLADVEDDALSQMCLSKNTLSKFVFYRIVIIYGLIVTPLLFGSYILSYIVHLPVLRNIDFFITVGLAIWLMVGLGLVMAVIAKALRNVANLLIIILLPLYLPIILWGAGSIIHIQNQMSNLFEINMLIGLSCLGVVLFPMLLKSAILIGVEQQ